MLFTLRCRVLLLLLLLVVCKLCAQCVSGPARGGVVSHRSALCITNFIPFIITTVVILFFIGGGIE